MIRPFMFSLLLVIVSCKKETSKNYDLVISNAQVIHLETGNIENQDIFINNGRIEMVEPAGSGNFKANTTIDASGKYVMPGLWDNHIHLRGGDTLIKNNKNFLKLFIANGITTVRDAGGDLTQSVMDWKSQIASGKLVGPTIFTAGPKIDGPKGSWAGSLEVETEEDVVRALDSLESLNVDFVKIYDSRISPDNYLKSIEEAKKRGFTVSGHMPFTVTLDETIDAGMDGIEHLYYIMKGCAGNEIEVTEKLNSGDIGFWGAMPALMEGYSDSTAQATFNKLKDNDVFVVPTLHIGNTLSYLDEVDHSSDEYLQYMGGGIIQTYQGRIQSSLNSSEEARKNRKQLDAFFGELVKALDVAGVQLLAGSDSGAFNSYSYPGISLHKELQSMVDKGISPLGALRTSTINGAKFLDQTEDYGSISNGNVSDLIILEANPLENIANTQKIYSVIKGNQVFSKNELQELLKNSIID
ncbi:MAG: amidohydrolase family protein [Flavobacteriaceae bacterium]|nr:amidohydrolase family protein [Flavobacteriaceae bacterium]